MKSSPANPFLFIFDGNVPSLKNGKEWGPNGVRSNTEVLVWYQEQGYRMQQQMPQHDIPAPKTLFYVRYEMYCKNAMTRNDLDNAYTSLQELLQPTSEREKGILGIVSDDKYVQGFSAVRLALNEQFPMTTALLWCWEFAGDDIEQLNVFKQHRDKVLLSRLKKPTSLSEFDF